MTRALTPPLTLTLTLTLATAAAGGAACADRPPPPITAAWSDGFDRTELGGDYRATGDGYELVNGALHAQGAYNHPLWLKRKIPRDVAIELDVWARSRDGDLKVEVFGDGSSHATSRGAYTATSYVLCMGGWNNSLSFIARMDEHAADRITRSEPRVEVGRRYRWKIVRRGGRLDWFVDDMSTPFLSLDDPQPLEGPGHEYFGFNNWQSDAWFDNLTITPL